VAVGALIVASGTSSVTDSTWDVVSGGSIPLNINDATTSSGVTTNTSYIYGDLLLGGTAPVEQIATTSSGSTAVFIVSNQTGVQGVFSSSGTVDELALYSLYGRQTIVSGTKVTPFGDQGSYTDSTGLIYVFNRYYDPTTGQFVSVDPKVATTDQPYVFTGDDPLNSTDPLGLTLATAAQALTNALTELTIRISAAASNPTAANVAAVSALAARVGSDTKAVADAVTPVESAPTSTPLRGVTGVATSPIVSAAATASGAASTILGNGSDGTLSGIPPEVRGGLQDLSGVVTVISGFGTSLNDSNQGHGIVYSLFDGLLQSAAAAGGAVVGAIVCSETVVLDAACAVGAGAASQKAEKTVFNLFFK
jgi:RHS repeat-associated protein